jgi:hypothetical protein
MERPRNGGGGYGHRMGSCAFLRSTNGGQEAIHRRVSDTGALEMDEELQAIRRQHCDFRGTEESHGGPDPGVRIQDPDTAERGGVLAFYLRTDRTNRADVETLTGGHSVAVEHPDPWAPAHTAEIQAAVGARDGPIQNRDALVIADVFHAHSVCDCDSDG